MNSEIAVKTKQVFEKVFPESTNNFDWDRGQSDYENWDSFHHANLISELENQFDIHFEIDEIISISSAKSALNTIMKKKNDN